MTITLGVTGLEVRCDSSLVVNQVNREYIARDARMAEYPQLVLALKSKIPQCNFKWVPRSENNHADSLANQPHSFNSDGRFSSSTSLIRSSND